MPFKETPIKGLKIFEPRIFSDDRGYFFESHNDNVFKEEGIPNSFVQDNESKSAYGTIRALHYQIGPFAQSKLVRVVKGKVLDVAVDLRENSTTYGQHFSVILSEENRKQLYIPKGFAHGFAALEENTIFLYKCDNFYSKEHEGGIFYNDPSLNIDWQLEHDQIKLSEKDLLLPEFGEHKSFSSFKK
jgi:dTDP-4-dehydrorhamnose 3,5-epimerase